MKQRIAVLIDRLAAVRSPGEAPEAGDRTPAGAGRPDEVEIRRNAALAAVVAALAGVVSAAYLARALSTGAWLDWLVCAGLGLLAVAHAVTFLDARTPVLVADVHGVRIRLGRHWHGVPWADLDEIEHLPRRGLLRDGRVVLFPLDPDTALAGLDRRARRQAALSERLHGAPLAVPLGLTTRALGADGDLTASLARLCGEEASVVEIVPPVPDDEPIHDASRSTRGPAPVLASSTPSPLREPVPASRHEVSREFTLGATALHLEVSQDPDATRALPELSELRRSEEELTEVIDGAAVEVAPEPVIGTELAAARERLGLAVEQLAERTRIRPHVIEAIEVDDFAPCGGDFYARGHLRTLARVLGLDAAPVLAAYDERYADGPIDPRRVFEAELSTGLRGSAPGSRGGPNWSVLVAAVMAVVLVWSIARLVMDSPASLTPPSPSLSDGSAGLTSGGSLAPPVAVVITAAGGGAHVVVRDGGGNVVFKGSLAFGESQTVKASPAVRVQSTDGSLEVSVAGRDRGALGATGQPAQGSFTVR